MTHGEQGCGRLTSAVRVKSGPVALVSPRDFAAPLGSRRFVTHIERVLVDPTSRAGEEPVHDPGHQHEADYHEDPPAAGRDDDHTQRLPGRVPRKRPAPSMTPGEHPLEPTPTQTGELCSCGGFS